jgi:hypothetical protein
MKDFAKDSASATAKWLVGQGFAVKVTAGALGAEHIGRGVLNEVWRDHEWFYLSGFKPRADGGVDVEYLTVEKYPPTANTEGNVKTVVEEIKVKKHVVPVAATVEITISTETFTRPVGKRTTSVVTTTTNEEILEDEPA